MRRRAGLTFLCAGTDARLLPPEIASWSVACIPESKAGLTHGVYFRRVSKKLAMPAADALCSNLHGLH